MAVAKMNLLVVFLVAVLSLARATFGQEAKLSDDKSWEVYVGFYIESLGDLRASDMAFDVDMYFRCSWLDESLSHDSGELKIISGANISNSLWVPDIYFANAKKAEKQDVTVPNKVMYIYPDGSVAFSSRVTLNVACTLRLENYPLDEQMCSIRIQSYGNPSKTLKLRWFEEDAITYNENIELPEFYIGGMEAKYCDGNYTYAKTWKEHKEGYWSCLSAVIDFKRSIGYHLVQTYIPTGMIVLISWVGFWIDRSAVPARISLSFTTLLTLSTMGAGLRYALPPVSYAKAIDYWYGMCMIFVFAALLEFAVVNSFVRRSQKYEAFSKKAKDDLEMPVLGGSSPTEIALVPTTRLNRIVDSSLYRASCKFSRHALLCDKCCRFAFPLAFAAFNCAYWASYM